jgi:hypothetical protein
VIHLSIKGGAQMCSLAFTNAFEIAAIEQAMQRSPAIWHKRGTSAARPAQALRSTGKYVAEREGFEPSMGF